MAGQLCGGDTYSGVCVGSGLVTRAHYGRVFLPAKGCGTVRFLRGHRDDVGEHQPDLCFRHRHVLLHLAFPVLEIRQPIEPLQIAANPPGEVAEVDGNRTRRRGFATANRFEGGGAHQVSDTSAREP